MDTPAAANDQFADPIAIAEDLAIGMIDDIDVMMMAELTNNPKEFQDQRFSATRTSTMAVTHLTVLVVEQAKGAQMDSPGSIEHVGRSDCEVLAIS